MQPLSKESIQLRFISLPAPIWALLLQIYSCCFHAFFFFIVVAVENGIEIEHRELCFSTISRVETLLSLLISIVYTINSKVT